MAPTDRGFTVALIGPDGAGKTTIAHELMHSLRMPTRYLYMGVNPESSNRQLVTTRLIHALKRARGAPPDRRGPRDPNTVAHRPRGVARRLAREAKSMLRLANRLAEEWYRQSLAWRFVRKGSIVIFDRHYFSDYHAYDVGKQARSFSQRLHGLVLTRLYPHPDLLIYLDAPAQVLFARKGEGTLESLERRRTEYRDLQNIVPRFAEVNANRPLQEVVTEVIELVTAFSIERSGRRSGRG